MQVVDTDDSTQSTLSVFHKVLRTIVYSLFVHLYYSVTTIDILPNY